MRRMATFQVLQQPRDQSMPHVCRHLGRSLAGEILQIKPCPESKQNTDNLLMPLLVTTRCSVM